MVNVSMKEVKSEIGKRLSRYPDVQVVTETTPFSPKAFELLKAHCKNRECNKDCIFFRELAIGENKDQYCALCEIVTSDYKEKSE